MGKRFIDWSRGLGTSRLILNFHVDVVVGTQSSSVICSFWIKDFAVCLLVIGFKFVEDFLLLKVVFGQLLISMDIMAIN